MINYSFTLYNDADSDAVVNAYQFALTALEYPAVAVKANMLVFAVAPVPQDLTEAFYESDLEKQKRMIEIAYEVRNSNEGDFNTAYHVIYDAEYP